jgi:hypothetical protein
MYTIAGTTYVLRNNGDQQVWYILNADNTQTKIDVEMFKSSQGYSQIYYYRFGTIWYKYINNNFVYYGVSPPPFYTGSQATFTVTNTVSSDSMVSSSSYLMPSASQYSIASSSSGSSSTSSYQYYRPVTDTVTVTETKPVVNNSNMVKMVKSKTIFQSEEDAPIADSLFGNW